MMRQMAFPTSGQGLERTEAVRRARNTMTLAEQTLEFAGCKVSLGARRFTSTQEFIVRATPGIVSTTMLLAPNNPAYKNDAGTLWGSQTNLRRNTSTCQ